MSKYFQKVEDFQEKYLENCMKTALDLIVKSKYEELRELFKDTFGDDYLSEIYKMIDEMEEKAVKEIEEFDLAKELAK